jgi:RimJ/RimL family protein N-acetyltransferase
MSWGVESTVFIWDMESSMVSSKLSGTLAENNWYAKSIESNDREFYQSLFSDECVMSTFAEGQVRSKEHTDARVKLWLSRFEKGQPHGSMTVFDVQTHQPLGHIIAGGGDEPGVSEVAYAYAQAAWGKGIGTNALYQIVNLWAPEVRRIGLGIGFNEHDVPVMNAFKCFSGEVLKRLDATTNPSNVASCKILLKNGFERAQSRVEEGQGIIELDYDAIYEREKSNSHKIEEFIIQKYYSQEANDPLEEGKRYLMIDNQGNERTFSKHKGYQKIKYHFEYHL